MRLLPLLIFLAVQPLHEGWRFRMDRGGQWREAVIPGTVHTDLLSAGVIDDPFVGCNERSVQWIDKEDWTYETAFVPASEIAASHRQELCFDGLDTYADVFLNDSLLFSSDNMFVRYRIDVTGRLLPGENRLRVRFHSPVKVDLPACLASPVTYLASNDQSENGGLLDHKVSVYARKAGYHYGWDWGPRLVTSGIWRSVRLEGWSGVTIRDVYYRQDAVDGRQARMTVLVDIEAEQAAQGVRICIYADGKTVGKRTLSLSGGRQQVEVPVSIPQPKRWWPNGLGSPYRYTFRAEVQAGTAGSDAVETRIGLRSIRLVRDGGAFGFEVNGHPVFMKGANYIPGDSFMPRMTDTDYRKVVSDAAAVHMNMLRVWGGGVYEDERFYDACDSLGILVWQDFMFACSLYPASGNLLRRIDQETVDNIRRLRNHPCLALWCGNNECNIAWDSWGWRRVYAAKGLDSLVKAQMDTVYFSMLPERVAEWDPVTPYTPTSPWYPQEGKPGPDEGDTHYWTVWAKGLPFSTFDRVNSRFFSEYGFQSFPSLETVRGFAPDPADWRIDSEVMLFHQRGGNSANERIFHALERDYGRPADFPELLYLSQLAQGDAVRTAIEAHRRDKPHCQGSLFWQINDCWPAASWSSREYDGTWKALHYFARDAFDPVLVSVPTTKDSLDVWVVSDRTGPLSGWLEICLRRFDGTLVDSLSLSTTIPGNASVRLVRRAFRDLLHGSARNETYLTARFSTAEGSWSRTRLLTSVHDARLEALPPHVEIQPASGGFKVCLLSPIFLRGVYLSIGEAGQHFSDNFFDLEPGIERTVTIQTALTDADFRRRLVVRSAT